MIRPFGNHPKSLLFVLFLMMGIILTPPATAAFKFLTEGMDAPEVKGKNILTGELVSSKKLAAENIVIVIFWSTWSERSIEQLKDVSLMIGDYPDQPVKVIGVNVDGPNLTPTAKLLIETKVKELSLPFPVIIDDNLDIFYQYGVIAVPSTAVIDTSGTLRYGPAGYSYTTRDRLVDSIQIFLGLKQPDKKTEFRQGYRPKNRSSRFYNMALNLTRLRSYERALAILDSAQTADSLFSAPRSLRGEILLSLDRPTEAVTEFSLAIKLDTMSVASWAGLGRAYLAANKLDSAQLALSKTLLLDDSYTPAFLTLGLCLSEKGESAAAIDSLVKARELNLADPHVHYYLGRVYRQAGILDKATESFKTALNLLFPPK